jgi:hypothetical protein
VIKAEAADNQINIYCNRKSITRPRDVKAKYTKVPNNKKSLTA